MLRALIYAPAILSLGWVAVHLVRRARSAVPPATGLRALALLAVLATGALLGAAGSWLTGSQYGYLAIPAAVAAGWLALADPLACQPPSPPSGSGADGAGGLS